MKRIIVLLVAIVLVMSTISFADSEDIQSYSEASGNCNTCHAASLDRGTNIPSTIYSLDNTYWGTAVYYVSVYTNCLFSDHNGCIQITVDNYNDIPGDDNYNMQVSLCHKSFWGTQIVDETRNVWVNGYDTLIFNGLDENVDYFFQFSQNFQTYATTTHFTIVRGN